MYFQLLEDVSKYLGGRKNYIFFLTELIAQHY